MTSTLMSGLTKFNERVPNMQNKSLQTSYLPVLPPVISTDLPAPTCAWTATA